MFGARRSLSAPVTTLALVAASPLVASATSLQTVLNELPPVFVCRQPQQQQDDPSGRWIPHQMCVQVECVRWKPPEEDLPRAVARCGWLPMFTHVPGIVMRQAPGALVCACVSLTPRQPHLQVDDDVADGGVGRACRGANG